MTTQVSVRDCVGAALRFVRERWRLIVITSLAGAVATASLVAIGIASPPINILCVTTGWIVQALVYAAFLKGALGSKERLAASEGFRLFGAMTVIWFFLFIVFVVLIIPGAIVLVVGPMSAYLPEMQRAGQDQAAMMQVMTRFWQENPAPLLAFFAFYGILWFLLTSRLYLAAPATIDAKRVLTFDTWRWTRAATLKIAGARIMLLVPAFILMGALSLLAARVLGVDPSSAAQQPPLPLYTAYIAFDRIVFFAAYLSLEAGLSTALYRALKPAESVSPKV